MEQGQDPVAVGPQVARPVVNLGWGVLDLVELSSQEIYVVPFRAGLFVVLDKGSMGLAELADSIDLILTVLFEGIAAGVGKEVIAEEEEIVLEEGCESRFEMLEKVNFRGIVVETGLPDLLLGALPVMGGDLVGLLGQGSAGRIVTDPGNGLLHFVLQAKNSVFHGNEV